MIRTTVSLVSLEAIRGYAKPKLEELSLMIWKFFENSYVVDTDQKTKKETLLFSYKS